MTNNYVVPETTRPGCFTHSRGREKPIVKTLVETNLRRYQYLGTFGNSC